MASHITVAPAKGTWIVRAGSAVLGETTRALEMREGSYAPVIYVPREDMAMAFLEKTARTTTCPHKGEANYYSVVLPSGTLADAVWSYEAPFPEVSAIAGHLAFYPDRVAVEPA
jgi:uncharacterized protein (DUF427 family)